MDYLSVGFRRHSLMRVSRRSRSNVSACFAGPACRLKAAVGVPVSIMWFPIGLSVSQGDEPRTSRCT